MDPSRQHVYAFLTDLNMCWLIKADCSFVDEVALVPDKLSPNAVRMSLFPWYSREKGVLGFKVLRALASMSATELGMASPLLNVDHPVKLSVLGTGSTAFVYRAMFLDQDPNMELVLKVAKPEHSMLKERETLLHLNALAVLLDPDGADGSISSIAAADAWAAEKALLHIPKVQAEPELGLTHDECLLSSPPAKALLPHNITIIYIQQAVNTLRWVHTQGYVHGDVSHHNLMLAVRGWRGEEPVAQSAPRPAKGSLEEGKSASLWDEPSY